MSARPVWSSSARRCLSGRGEASGVALAQEILALYAELTTGPRIAFFETLATTFGPDRARIDRAIAAWREAPSDETAADLHVASEPRRLELFRRLNLAPNGTSGAGAHARAAPRRHGSPPQRARGDRQRFRSSVLVVVQSRLSGAAPHRLVDLGGDPGKDHPLRGGARNPRLGAICAGASIRRTAAATPSSIRRWSTSR